MIKFLIIRLSSYGDIVLTTPLIRCLKNQCFALQKSKEKIEIHYLIKHKFYDAIKANPNISKFHIVENDLSEIIPQLKEENFDYIIDLHNNIRSIYVKYNLKKQALSVDKINFRKWLMVNFKWNILPQKHIVDRYLETIQPLGIENDMMGLDYFIPKEDEIDLKSLPLSHQNGYVAFVIGGNYFTKKLPFEKIISICQKINNPVILLGGLEDLETGEKIAAHNLSKCYNACGKYNINQSASLIKQAKKVITHDTGLMHIAAAFKKEIISIWGNTIPELGMYPYYGNFEIKNQNFEIKNLSCRPCSKLGYKKCPQKHFMCMNLHDENEIAKMAGF